MDNFLRLGSGLDVLGLQLELVRQPQLWGQRKFRTTFRNSPHVDVADIWLRFDADPNDPETVRNNVRGLRWYPEVQLLPAVRPLVLTLMGFTGAWSLERLLVSKIPPGGRIMPHADDRGEYVNLPGINRYHIVVQGLPGSLFKTGEETVQMLTGEAWWFNPKVEHECLNNSADDRIHLLVDLRTWPLPEGLL